MADGPEPSDEKTIEFVYQDLRRLAGYYLRAERSDHTLQATALVHEAYLRIYQSQGFEWRSRGHFVAVAAKAMRRILIDHARKTKAVKRGGVKISLDSALVYSPAQSSQLLALDRALQRLAERDERAAQVVEMRFFGGMEIGEIADLLEISERTVKRDWNVARAWLFGELNRSS